MRDGRGEKREGVWRGKGRMKVFGVEEREVGVEEREGVGGEARGKLCDVGGGRLWGWEGW